MSNPAAFPADPQTSSSSAPRTKVAIIDYGLGNLASVQHACDAVGLTAAITSRSEELRCVAGMILPGVGAFGDAMETLRRRDLLTPILRHINEGGPFFGICLGMQLLMTESEEFGHHDGLDVFHGTVIQFPHHNDHGDPVRVPQVGWNTIRPNGDGWRTPLLDGVAPGAFMYFVHSFRVVPEDPSCIVSMSEYEGVPYVSGIARENVVAVQFHPEKSGMLGLQMYKNFARLVTASSMTE